MPRSLRSPPPSARMRRNRPGEHDVVLVIEFDFGTDSPREQMEIALKAAGMTLIIAGLFRGRLQSERMQRRAGSYTPSRLS